MAPQHGGLATSNTRSQSQNPIPQEPLGISILQAPPLRSEYSPGSSLKSMDNSPVSSDSESPQTPRTDPQVDEALDELSGAKNFSLGPTTPKRRRASTKLISQSPQDVRRLLDNGSSGDINVGRICCGGGCCFAATLEEDPAAKTSQPVVIPKNEAFSRLHLKLGPLSLDSELTNIVDLPSQTVYFEKPSGIEEAQASQGEALPPKFVTPHPPYDVFPARVHHARELTKSGAERRTYHFDLDVTDYPKESGTVDFVVGGAIGICAPNMDEIVEEIFDLLHVPHYVRDRATKLKTESGRWPTIWGDEMSRELLTTRRELLTWCSDVQSYPPTKALLRLLAEYAEAPNEKKILLYLSSAQGQTSFCDLRTGPPITLSQLLSAFPSSRPPLPHILSVLNTLMPRFYSLSQDPQISCTREGKNCRRLIEIAVTVNETPNWRGGPRTGVGSGFLERVARTIQEAEKRGRDPKELDIRLPMFRGLMANPLAREFVADGPLLLIGAGVGIAPFRGFVQRRLQSANCANKVWVLQGIRDSLLDELYSGEWGVQEDKVKKVVQSRRGESKYVQEEVRTQADLVWFVINALDGRVFVCGSGKGMGEGVEAALIDVAMQKGNLNREGAEQFWVQKKDGGQYVAVSRKTLHFRDRTNHLIGNMVKAIVRRIEMYIC